MHELLKIWQKDTPKSREEIIEFWEASGFLENLQNELKFPLSLMFQKAYYYLSVNPINKEYDGLNLEFCICPVIRRVFLNSNYCQVFNPVILIEPFIKHFEKEYERISNSRYGEKFYKDYVLDILSSFEEVSKKILNSESIIFKIY